MALADLAVQCFKRPESPLSWLPKWLLPLLFEYVASRSKVNEWHQPGAPKEV